MCSCGVRARGTLKSLQKIVLCFPPASREWEQKGFTFNAAHCAQRHARNSKSSGIDPRILFEIWKSEVLARVSGYLLYMSTSDTQYKVFTIPLRSCQIRIFRFLVFLMCTKSWPLGVSIRIVWNLFFKHRARTESSLPTCKKRRAFIAGHKT